MAKTLREIAAEQGVSVGYDPKTKNVTLGSLAFQSGYIPGTTLQGGSNVVTNPELLSRTLAAAKGSAGTTTANTGGTNEVGGPRYWQPQAYQAPSMPTLSYGEAMSQAGREINPVTQLMQDRTNRMYQQQTKDLPLYLNAKGRLGGGSEIAGRNQLVTEQARTLNDIDLEQQAKVVALARALQERNQDTVRQQLQDSYQQWADQQNMGYQAWKSQYDVNQDEKDRADEAAKLAQAAAQWEKQFGLTQDEFGLQKQQWQSSPEAQSWYLPTYQKQLQAELANTQRSANAPYGGGGGSSTANTKDTYTNNLSVAKQSLLRYKSFNDMIADVGRMTETEKSLLGPGGWDKLWTYANSSAVKGQYFNIDGDSVTPPGFIPKSGSPLRNSLGTNTSTTTVSDDELLKYLK